MTRSDEDLEQKAKAATLAFERERFEPDWLMRRAGFRDGYLHGYRARAEAWELGHNATGPYAENPYAVEPRADEPQAELKPTTAELLETIQAMRQACAAYRLQTHGCKPDISALNRHEAEAVSELERRLQPKDGR